MNGSESLEFRMKLISKILEQKFKEAGFNTEYKGLCTVTLRDRIHPGMGYAFFVNKYFNRCKIVAASDGFTHVFYGFGMWVDEKFEAPMSENMINDMINFADNVLKTRACSVVGSA